MSFFIGLFSSSAAGVLALPADTLASLSGHLSGQSLVEWIEIHLDDEILYFSKVAYNELGGPFTPRLLTVGNVRRALSDELTGSSDRPSYTFSLMDGPLPGAQTQARVLRASYDSATWKGREAVAKMATLDTLRAGGTPVTLYRCYMQAFAWTDLTMTVEGVDFLSGQGKLGEPDFMVPTAKITRGIHTGLPANHPALGMPAPYIFGVLDDATPGYGPVPIIPLDIEHPPASILDYRVGLLAYHACPPITGLYIGSDQISLTGTTVLVPGYPGYESFFGASAPLYVDKNGQRMTRVLVFAGARWHDDWVAGSIQLTATCAGVEDSPRGDGTGTPIEDLLKIELWAWANLRLNSHRPTSSLFLGPPTFISDGRSYLDVASYEAVRVSQTVVLGAPFSGAFMLGGKAGAMSWDAFLAMIRRATVTRGYINEFGQHAITYYNYDAAVTDDIGIDTTLQSFAEGAVTLQPQDGLHYTVFRATSGKMYVSDGWERDNVEIRALDATVEYGREYSPVYALEPIRSWADVRNIGLHLLARHSGRPLQVLTAPALVQAAGLNPGTVLTATHPMGAGANGWVDRITDLLSVDLNADEKTVQIALLDHEQPVRPMELQISYVLTTLTRGGTYNRTATGTTFDDITDWIFDGDVVTIEGVSPVTYNGSWSVTPTGTHTFTWVLPDNPGSNGSGSMNWGAYNQGDRRTKPRKVDVVDPSTGTGPIVDNVIDLGGSSEVANALTPAANTYTRLYDRKPKRIQKANYGRRRFIVEVYLGTNNGGTDLRAAVYLTDGGSPLAESEVVFGPTPFVKVDVVMQDFTDDSAPIDLLVDGENNYEVRVKRSNTSGYILAYAVAKPL